MENFNKLKWSPGWFIPIIIFLFLFAIAFEIVLTQRIGYTVWLFGTFFILLGIYDYYRTRLVTFLIIGILFGTGTWHSMLAFGRVAPFSIVSYTVHIVAVIFFFIFTWPVIRQHYQLSRYARRLFRMASDMVHDHTKGYTNRPFSAGRIEIPFEEVEGFVRYINGKHIAKAVNHQNNIALVFSLGISPLSNPDSQKVSRISFSKEGELSVHISPYDYSRFRNELTFDRLCEALANLFTRFARYYAEGKESRIDTELNA